MGTERSKRPESVTDKLRKFDPLVAVANATREPLDAPAKSSPGQFGEFMRRESEVFKENDDLKKELKDYKTGSLTKRIPAELVVRSKWANRHEQSFNDSDFEKFKVEIDSAGGNVQPIKVRPANDKTGKFEIIFGHRRHQACLELGLPVLVMIDEANDQQLFAEMDRENRLRKDLRPYEQGLMYRQALDEGLFPSARKMAEAIGVNLANLGKSLMLARLPAAVLGAFITPLDIQLRWASDINQAIQKNPELVIKAAEDIKLKTPRPSSKVVLQMLVAASDGGVVPNYPSLQTRNIRGVSGQEGIIERDDLRKEFSLRVKNIEPSRMEILEKMIRKIIDDESSLQ